MRLKDASPQPLHWQTEHILVGIVHLLVVDMDIEVNGYRHANSRDTILHKVKDKSGVMLQNTLAHCSTPVIRSSHSIMPVNLKDIPRFHST